ncbi:LAFE_0G16776g1_1 [Lachancea fermentati]|uniref:LAFE_0G16776g1_1 n=1 Tax=Lachancea fermentati TaxID=4955 RepID=A0A1G4MIW0_LACFM|nr:LAFE_0G16776g1_1 [Lachancea fermentati]
MSFFYHNTVIQTCQRIFRRPADAAMWLFTALVVASTVYTLVWPSGRRPRGPSR